MNKKIKREMYRKFPYIERSFVSTYIQEFKHADPENVRDYNTGMGTIIRVRFLTPQNLLFRYFKDEGVAKLEDMSLQIIEEFHEYLQTRSDEEILSRF